MLAEHGDCGAAVTIKGYCFADGAQWLAAHPGKANLDVIAMHDHWAIGSFIPFNSGQGWDVYSLSRAGAGFKADQHRQFGTQVRVPQGCLFQGVVQEAWLIGVARGRKVAIEAKQYACDGWRGPVVASLRSDLEGEPFIVDMNVAQAVQSAWPQPRQTKQVVTSEMSSTDMPIGFRPNDADDIYGSPTPDSKPTANQKRRK